MKVVQFLDDTMAQQIKAQYSKQAEQYEWTLLRRKEKMKNPKIVTQFQDWNIIN